VTRTVALLACRTLRAVFFDRGYDPLRRRTGSDHRFKRLDADRHAPSPSQNPGTSWNAGTRVYGVFQIEPFSERANRPAVEFHPARARALSLLLLSSLPEILC